MSVDLGALRMAPTAPAPLRRPLGPRLFGAALLLLAAAVVGSFVWPLLRPVRAVPMAAVRTSQRGPVAASAGAPVAEAAGWVEPDPFPVVVRPLVAGRIEALLVLEGAALRAGETVIARLQSAELQAADERARAELALREAELAAAAKALQVAEQVLAQRAELRTQLAEAVRAVAMAEEQAAEGAANLARARGDAAGAAAALQAQEQLLAAGGTNAVAVARARAAAAAAAGAVAAAEQEQQALQRAVAAALAQRELAEELAARPVALQGAVATAEAAVAQARAARDAAAAGAAIAARELAWTEVKSPVDGVVMRLLAQPGETTGPDGPGLVSAYDPARLRARIDVPLGMVAAVHDGQQALITSEVLGAQVVQGTVQRLQRESDLLKNTLQVKVALHDPPPLLRPETLCRARFLASAAPAGQGEGEAAAPAAELAFLVPAAAVQGEQVFVHDAQSGRARAVAVRVLGRDGDDALVQGELSVAQRVILVPVQAGEAVREAP